MHADMDYTPGSEQYEWLISDLEKVDRSVTPWVIIHFHNPWYTTDPSYKEFEQMRVALEPITYEYGTDLFFYGKFCVFFPERVSLLSVFRP